MSILSLPSKRFDSFPGIKDIELYIPSHVKGVMGPKFHSSSLEGQMSITNFFHMLDELLDLKGTNDYQLQQLDDKLRPLASPVVRRSSAGNIVRGIYLIDPATDGGTFSLKVVPTLCDLPPKTTRLPVAKKAKYDRGANEKSERDPSGDSQSFKMRLVHRDKGCVACLAAGVGLIYKYCHDSNRFEGAHIIGLAYHKLWDSKGFSSLVSDPYTDPSNASIALAAPTTRTKKDPGRMNSLENGILLCLQHHKDYDELRFSIYPEINS